MPHDLFIAYCGRDKWQSHIPWLIYHIEAGFSVLAGRPLVPFLDPDRDSQHAGPVACYPSMVWRIPRLASLP
ncbi:MAG: hypothetical protein NT154_11270 [Verrucomicrobia bacterium]|nr:hypothetical protein [Verrucomicrobiota bacterium]